MYFCKETGKEYLMKTKNILFALPLIVLFFMMLACNNSADNAQNERQDSLMKVRNDSIRQAELDSLQKSIAKDTLNNTAAVASDDMDK
jgi:choline-glycine betaine transporter